MCWSFAMATWCLLHCRARVSVRRINDSAIHRKSFCRRTSKLPRTMMSCQFACACAGHHRPIAGSQASAAASSPLPIFALQPASNAAPSSAATPPAGARKLARDTCKRAASGCFARCTACLRGHRTSVYCGTYRRASNGTSRRSQRSAWCAAGRACEQATPARRRSGTEQASAKLAESTSETCSGPGQCFATVRHERCSSQGRGGSARQHGVPHGGAAGHSAHATKAPMAPRASAVYSREPEQHSRAEPVVDQASSRRTRRCGEFPRSNQTSRHLADPTNLYGACKLAEAITGARFALAEKDVYVSAYTKDVYVSANKEWTAHARGAGSSACVTLCKLPEHQAKRQELFDKHVNQLQRLKQASTAAAGADAGAAGAAPQTVPAGRRRVRPADAAHDTETAALEPAQQAAALSAMQPAAPAAAPVYNPGAGAETQAVPLAVNVRARTTVDLAPLSEKHGHRREVESDAELRSH